MRTEKITLNEERNVTLTAYLQETGGRFDYISARPGMLIIPGGGYQYCSEREADPPAMAFLKAGFQVFILNYSIGKDARWPNPLEDYEKAMELIHARAEEWKVYEDKVAVLGFSAGGHLAASLGNFWNSPFLKEQLAGEMEAGKEPAMLAESIRPNAQILCYPVISGITSPHEGSFRNLIGPRPEAGFRERCRALSMEKCVGPDTPPTFLWHCLPDDTVPAVNSLLMAEALWQEQVPVELHLYGTGGHALGTADALSLSVDGRGVQPECANWMELCHTWLKHIWKEAV